MSSSTSSHPVIIPQSTADSNCSASTQYVRPTGLSGSNVRDFSTNSCDSRAFTSRQYASYFRRKTRIYSESESILNSFNASEKVGELMHDSGGYWVHGSGGGWTDSGWEMNWRSVGICLLQVLTVTNIWAGGSCFLQVLTVTNIWNSHFEVLWDLSGSSLRYIHYQ